MDEFEDIIGYEGLYKINKQGDIYSNHFKKIFKPTKNKNGYFQLNLTKNKISKKYYLHRLIALQFIENPNNYNYIDHIDKNKTNNKLENLRWINASGNNRNVIRNKKSNLPRGVYKNKRNKYEVKISIDNKRIYLGIYETEIEASECYEKKYNEIMETFN